MKKVFVFVVLFIIHSSIALTAQDFTGIKKIKGNDIFCRVIGSGEPLVIVHGGPGMAHNYLFKPFSQLSDKYRLFFYDQRGSGLSQEFKENDSVSVEDLVDDLEALRAEFGIDKIYLAGQSWGASIAVYYAEKYPQHVKKLLLLEPMPGSSEYMKEVEQTIMTRLTKSDLDELIAISGNPKIKKDPELFNRKENLLFKVYYFDTLKMDKNKMAYMDSVRIKKSNASSKMFHNFLYNYSLYSKLEKIKCPILIIHGDYDVVPNESIVKMAECNKKTELHIIKDCGHFVHSEKEKEYFDLIRTFLKK